MTDQTIPAGITPEDAKKAREWALHTLNEPGASTTAKKAAARVVIGTVPEPRPTLADMSMEERAACQWMQADVEGLFGRCVITYPCDDDGDVGIVSDSGWPELFPAHRVTPRPDLPPLEWPGTEKPAPAPALPEGWRLADHEKRGRVIVTNDAPNTAGHVCFVLPADDPLGYDWLFCDPAELRYLDQEADPAPATLTEGSEWGDIDALTDACRESGRDQIVVIDCEGDVSVWSADAEWWEASLPSDGYEPFTIIHAGKKGGRQVIPTFHEEWRTIDPYSHELAARHYTNRDDARADAERFSFRVVQKRLVSKWEVDQ